MQIRSVIQEADRSLRGTEVNMPVHPTESNFKVADGPRVGLNPTRSQVFNAHFAQDDVRSLNYNTESLFQIKRRNG